MSTRNSNQNVVAALLVALLALAGLNIYQFINRNSLVKANKQQETELIGMEKAKTELEKEYYESLSELEEMKSNNEELNTMIDGQKEELTKQKDRITVLLRDSRNLKTAREEINKLKEQGEQYLAEVTMLREENEKLLASNTELSAENSSLSSEVESQMAKNEELTGLTTNLSKENEELNKVKTSLSRKVDMASMIEVTKIDVKGFEIKSNGDLTRKRRSDNVDMLKICFNTTPNELASAGNEKFLIRIINPIGQTLVEERLGSGITEVGVDNQQIRYTRSVSTDYNQDDGEVCADWKPGADFNEGLYTVEIYNKGYLAGNSSFRLR
jgi:myosin heavy subunit